MNDNSLTQSAGNCNPILNPISEDRAFLEYRSLFVQPIPLYTVKVKNWKTKHKSLSDKAVRAHLNQQYHVGCLGRWYPKASLFDIDIRSRDTAEEIRSDLKMDEDNSMLCSSESEDSYHLLFKPVYKGNPATLSLLKSVLMPLATRNVIELYPQAKKPVRLPFGKYQLCIDPVRAHLNHWQDLLYCFQKLDDYDISIANNIIWETYTPDTSFSDSTSTYNQATATELFESGLVTHSSREESQFILLYSFYRQNIPPDQASDMVWNWIQTKHNGFSNEIITRPAEVQNHIERQAKIIWDNYGNRNYYPDSTHNDHQGIITKPDLIDIINYGQSSPKMKFLFEVVRYYYPRQYRPNVHVHRNKLIKWSSRGSYLKYLNELKSIGILTRSAHYQPEKFSKAIKLKWKFRPPDQAILIDDRSPVTFEETLKAAFDAEELKQVLKSAGMKRTTILRVIKAVFS